MASEDRQMVSAGESFLGEALRLYLDDLDLMRGDEHLTVLDKGERKRTVLLDDPALVVKLWEYVKGLAYTHGSVFQAGKDGRGGPICTKAFRSAGEPTHKVQEPPAPP